MGQAFRQSPGHNRREDAGGFPERLLHRHEQIKVIPTAEPEDVCQVFGFLAVHQRADLVRKDVFLGVKQVERRMLPRSRSLKAARR